MVGGLCVLVAAIPIARHYHLARRFETISLGAKGASCPSAPAAPAPAQYAGYCSNTFNASNFSNANVDVGATNAGGFQWYVWNFFNVPQYPNMISLAGGVLSIQASPASPPGECCVASAVQIGPSSFRGTAFGGGGYFEATLNFDPTLVDVRDGWPSWWTMSLEHLVDMPGQQWAGQPAGYLHFIEPDIFEFFRTAKRPRRFSSSLHEWYGAYQVTCPGSAFCSYSLNNVATAEPVSYTVNHRYGMLWIPATSRAEGSFTFYLDGVQYGPVTRYSLFVATRDAPPPSDLAPWSFGVVDANHLVLILGSGFNAPVNVSSVRVWQSSASGNLQN